VIEKNAYELILHDSDFSMGQFYSAGSDASFPYVNISEPIAAYAGSDIYYKSTLKDCFRYQYENAVIHRQGLGFRGFGKITAINSRGQRTVSTYNPYSFSTLASVVSPTGESSFDYTCPVQWNKIRKVNMTHSVKEDLLTGFIEESTCQYDAYGYPTNLSKTYSDGISETSVIDYTSNTAVGNGYCLGFPNSRVRTVTRNNDTYTERIYSTSFNSSMQPLDRFLSVNGVDIRSHTFAYDGNGNMTAETAQKYADGNIQTSTYTYDTYGRLLQKTDPAGLSTQYTYNSRGKVAIIVDCLNNTTSFAYNNLDQPTTTTYPDGTTKATAYEWTSDSYGSLWKITQTATGKPETSLSVDAFGRETLSSQQLVDKTVFTVSKYDDYGNLTHKSLPFSTNGYPYYTVNTFDVYNRITSTTEYGGGQTIYGYSGNTVTVTNDSRSVSKSYNSQGEVTSVTDPAGTITYELAADGQPISITAPGNAVTTFAYDQTRRRTSLTDPSFGTTTYTYDSRGNMATETDADGNTCSYTYDSLDRIVEKETPDLTVAYTYNSLGQLTSAVGDNSTARRFTYDTYGRISTEKYEAPDSKWLQKAYTYSNGNLSSTAFTSQSGLLATENYSYYNGHLLETTANGNSIGYCASVNNFGNPLQITRGSLADNYTYTNKGLLSEHTAAWDSNNIQKYFYNFSPQTGNLTSRYDLVAGGLENFTYDSLDRLTAYGGETVEYDVKGNILSKSDVGTFGYNNGSKPYAVTDISQTAAAIPSVSQNITYNYFRQPLTITEGTHTASFLYDGEDSRVKMQVTQSGSNKLTRYYLGGCYETDITPSGTTERLYLGGDYYTAPAVLVKTSSGTSLYYIVRDHLGSITHVLNTSGTDLQHLSYDAWGRLRNPSNKQVYSAANTPTLLLGRGYTGHEHLTDFGLINMNGRLYDPVLGRFLSPDNYVQSPLFSQNFNRYSYCLNNPLRFNDKDGDWILELVLAIVGAYIGGVASNHGELNPGHWNYKAATTWLGIGTGAILGYAGGYGLAHPGTMIFGASISTPWTTVGITGSSAAALGKGTDWKFNFHWTTAAGGGGTTEYSPSKLDEQVGQIFDDTVDKMNDYYQSYSDMITYSLDAANKYAQDFDNKFLKNTYSALNYASFLCDGKEILSQPTLSLKTRKAFEVVGKNAGQFIGGRTMGIISFSLAAETGYMAPISPYVGYFGYIYGSYRGGKEGEYYAGRFFDSMYSVYLVGRKLKRISNLSNFYQQMYNNNPSPYPF
jgi:RHS repeat-associated protein